MKEEADSAMGGLETLGLFQQWIDCGVAVVNPMVKTLLILWLSDGRVEVADSDSWLLMIW